MTDTARSLAAIKALLADNSTAQISPQDLRDVVESIANPIPGGGFDADLTMDYFASSHLPGLTLPGGGSPWGETKMLSMGSTTNLNGLIDPSGWLGTSFTSAASDPDNAWSVDIAARDAVLLPRGLYRAEWFFGFTAGIPESFTNATAVTGAIDQATFDPDFSGPYDGSVPYLWRDYRGGFDGDWYGKFPRYNVGGVWIAQVGSAVIVNDESDPKPFALFVGTVDYPDDVTLSYWGVNIWKIR
jgi:hypothetical protein